MGPGNPAVAAIWWATYNGQDGLASERKISASVSHMNGHSQGHRASHLVFTWVVTTVLLIPSQRCLARQRIKAISVLDALTMKSRRRTLDLLTIGGVHVSDSVVGAARAPQEVPRSRDLQILWRGR